MVLANGGHSDPASFRDRTAQVFHHHGDIYRGLSAPALAAWRALAATRFWTRMAADGRVVATTEVDPASLALEQRWDAVLRHEKIPVISYPYEWPFSMLKDAALLQLDLLLAALDEGLTMKDATSFNVQWKNGRPVFIDVSSFEPLESGQPWVGYRQFCQTFLYPLLLQAYKGVGFHAWLRGSLEGISPHDMRQLMSFADLRRPGVLRHVHLHAAMQQRNEAAAHSVKSELQATGFPIELIRNNMRGLRRLTERLAWDTTASTWSDYATTHSYDAANDAAKKAFVANAAAGRRWSVAWDLGCNTGTYSQILAEHAETVVALDADHLAVDRLYRGLATAPRTNLLPLVMSLTDPSPGLGWRGVERQALVDRGRPELVVALALIHHVVIAGHVPLPAFVDWLAAVTDNLVIEFVSKDDAMVKRLLQNKTDHYADYDRDVLVRCLERHYVIVRSEKLAMGTRELFFASRRP